MPRRAGGENNDSFEKEPCRDEAGGFAPVGIRIDDKSPGKEEQAQHRQCHCEEKQGVSVTDCEVSELNQIGHEPDNWGRKKEPGGGNFSLLDRFFNVCVHCAQAEAILGLLFTVVEAQSAKGGCFTINAKLPSFSIAEKFQSW